MSQTAMACDGEYIAGLGGAAYIVHGECGGYGTTRPVLGVLERHDPDRHVQAEPRGCRWHRGRVAQDSRETKHTRYPSRLAMRS